MSSTDPAVLFPGRSAPASGPLWWARSRRAVLLLGRATNGAVMLLLLASNRPLRRRTRRVLTRARVLAVRLLRDVFGLAFIGGRRLTVAAAAGVAAAFCLHRDRLRAAPGRLLSQRRCRLRMHGTRPSPGPQRRVPPAFFAIYAPAPEELAYRGLLLVVCAVVMAAPSNRWVRGAVIVAALIGTSWVFGLAHLNWSLLNAVSASMTGAVAMTARAAPLLRLGVSCPQAARRRAACGQPDVPAALLSFP